MKIKLLLIIITTFFLTNSYSQEQCGTMKNLEEQIKKDPSIKKRMLQIEKQNQEWIEKNGRGSKKHVKLALNKNYKSISKSSLNTNGLCAYNNTLSTTITAPTIEGTIVSPSPNCITGGQYVRVINLIAGNTYRISTIGVDNFDTQITIYPAGGGSVVAFNDDWDDSLQSEIYFTAFVSGNYDILINNFGCSTTPLCASLEIELWYIPRPVITIPVVFHIFNKGEPIGTGANISVAQIQSQIDVLNEDFRRLNSSINSTPPPFKGASADPLIQFCLAQQKPDGTPTNGIMRYLITQEYLEALPLPTELQCLNLLVIEYELIPKTIWNRDKYLNIWVSDMQQLPPIVSGKETKELGCNYRSGTIGFAQFPGQLATKENPHPELTDGVWLNYTTVGRIDNSSPNYNLGTNATHEIGHWLNLKHIWGDEEAYKPPLPECSLDDDVLDTPLQGTNSNQLYNSLPINTCPSFPVYDNCTNNYPGIMFMNYMDYGIDQCKSTFTFLQTARMDAALFNQRASLLTSPGCLPGSFNVVISQIYGGGGNQNATYTNDYIELFNSGTVARNLNGWSVQYVPATAPTAGLTWFTIPLPNFTLQPGQYFLIKCAAGTTVSAALPLEDAIDTTITLSSTAGKVILVSNTTPETSVNPTGSQIIDKVGYGITPNGYEGSGPTGTLLSNTTAAFRKLNGCTDTDNNISDFSVGTPSPRNSSSALNLCSSLSVSQNELEMVTLYPNPTTSKVFFDNSNSNFKEVAVYNYLGQKVATTSFTSAVQNQEIDMSTLTSGIYILKFSDGATIKSAKVIKQ